MPRKPSWDLVCLFLSLSFLVACCSTLEQAADSEDHQWWQHAVFYEIYPRSFADSNNDGIGDLNGITSKLDYLKDLGVDAIWITPCFPSPQVDFGYDVSDYENIDPMYGTLADFDMLSQRGQEARHPHHPRFRGESLFRPAQVVSGFEILAHLEASRLVHLARRQRRRASRRITGLPTFGGSAWKFDPTTNQYYYHYFYTEQPDLNWRNPAVKEAMFDVTRWWYKRGVSGFRLDAVDTLFEDPDLHDNPLCGPARIAYGDPYAGEQVQHQAARSSRRAARTAQGGRRIQRRADRRNLDRQYRRAERILRRRQQRIAVAHGFPVHQGQQAFARRIPQADCRSQLRVGLAHVRDQQSRHRPLLRSLRRWPAQRSDREADGRALSHACAALRSCITAKRSG